MDTKEINLCYLLYININNRIIRKILLKIILKKENGFAFSNTTTEKLEELKWREYNKNEIIKNNERLQKK